MTNNKRRGAEAELRELKARIEVSRAFFTEQANGPDGVRREMALLVLSTLDRITGVES